MSVVVVSMVLFALGLYGILTRRDVVAVLASIEVFIGAPLLLLVALGAGLGGGAHIQGIALLVMVLAAAEAAVGLALAVTVARRMRTTRLDEMNEVSG